MPNKSMSVTTTADSPVWNRPRGTLGAPCGAWILPDGGQGGSDAYDA